MSTETIHREAFGMLCGALIGRGMSREVYECAVLPGYVVKVEGGSGRFQNIIEWETWQRVRDTPASRWFAECKWISPAGIVMIMERTAQPTEYPSHLPRYLTDTKVSNYGLSMLPDPKTGRPSNRFVCHDYGTNLLFEHGMNEVLRRVKWHDSSVPVAS